MNEQNGASGQKNAALASFKHKAAKGFMRNRFFALIIDFIIVSLLCQFVVLPLFQMPDWDRYMQMQDAVKGLVATDPLVIERMRLYQQCFIVTLTVGLIYEALMLVFFNASVGKLIFKQQVKPSKEGRGFFAGKLFLVLRSMIKMFSMYLLSALPFVFMCLTAFGNADRRSGFDVFSGTKVIDRRNST